MSQLILVGTGHVHLGLFARIPLLHRKGHQVTVISQSSTYCYSGMAPGVLGGQYDENDIILEIKAVVEGFGVRFIPQKVVHIDPKHHRLTLEDGSSETYDTVSFNIGSRIQVEGLSLDPGRTIPAKPIINFLKIRERVESLLDENRTPRIIVAGGGPAGLEIAANLCRLAERRSATPDVTLVSSGPLLSDLPAGARRTAVKALKRAGVRIMEDARLSAVEDRRVGLLDGSKLEADLVILATGIKPQSLFTDSGLPVGEDGGLLVNKYLQSVDHPDIFGGGDCVTPESGRFPRIGVVACRQNPVITRNIIAALEKGKLSSFRRRKSYLQIFNLGAGRALMVKGCLWFSGRPAFRLKDAIDSRFIGRLKRSVGAA
ncbi:MAG: FAD-dependent oxidoreductase [Spirochaetaceae bacterium]|nr:FAD-dependent oxidoreductase [Spirochaetaceae bacterium]